MIEAAGAPAPGGGGDSGFRSRFVEIADRTAMDARQGLRSLLHNPLSAAVMVVSLAVGVGANVAVFSLVSAVLLRPLPYREPERLVMVWDRVERLGQNRNIVSPSNYVDWQRRNAAFARMAAYTETYANIESESGDAERVAGVAVTPTFFETLGTLAGLGRVLSADDTSGAFRPIVISHSLWARRFGADPGIVGRKIRVGGALQEVVGVLPEAFHFSAKKVEVFSLLSPTPEAIEDGRNRRYLTVVARLRPGVSVSQAQAGMTLLAEELARDYPDANKGRGVHVVALVDEVLGAVTPVLLLLQAVAGCLLLIAVANAASLYVTRALSRTREFATRSALGATPRRLVQQMLTESCVLAAAVAAVGMALGSLGVRLIRALSAVSVPQIETIGVDGRVVLFALALAVSSVAIAGLLPALRCSKADIHHLLRAGGKGPTGTGRHGAQKVFVAGQVAVSLLLLIGTGLLAKSLVRLQHVDPGFSRSGLVTLELSLPRRYSGEACARFFEELLGRVQSLPGVRFAGLTSHLPLSGEDGSRRFVLLDDPANSDEMPASEYRRVSHGYFDSIGMRLVRGRFFAASDTTAAPAVAIVNEAFVRRFVPGREALRQKILIEDGSSRPREVVGVVGDVRHFALQVPSVPEMYIPHSDRPWPNMTLVVSGAGRSAAVPVAAIRRELASLDKSIPLGKVITIEEHLAAASETQRFTTGLLAAFGAMALLLAIIGIYGLVSLRVAERRVELGLRMAIGADGSEIVRLILREGAVLLGTGLALGLCLAALVTPRLGGLLFTVGALDPVIFTLVPLALMAAGMCACYWPARAAGRVDPLVCMRE